MAQQTSSVELLIAHLKETYHLTDETLFELERTKEMHKQESLELIKLASQLTGVAMIDEKIAKMEYIDVYNQYYNKTYLNK